MKIRIADFFPDPVWVKDWIRFIMEKGENNIGMNSVLFIYGTYFANTHFTPPLINCLKQAGVLG